MSRPSTKRAALIAATAAAAALAQLLGVGLAYKPDLVIIGFFENDIDGNIAVAPASRRAVSASRAASWVSRHVYSLQWYRRTYPTLRWQASRSGEYKTRLETLAANEALTARSGEVQRRSQQQLTPVDRLSDEQVPEFVCDGGERPSANVIADIQRNPGWPSWVRAVRDLQALHRSGTYRILFFVNIAAPGCPHGDRVYDGGSSVVNPFYLDALGAGGTPAISSYDTYLHRRPSRMPLASSHSIGNSNTAKAETLFAYLSGDGGALRDLTVPLR